MGEVIHEALHLQLDRALFEWLFSTITSVVFTGTVESIASLSLKSASLSRCLVHGCRSFASFSSIDSVASHFTEAAFS